MVVYCVYELGHLAVFPDIIFEDVLMLFCGTILHVGEVTSNDVNMNIYHSL